MTDVVNDLQRPLVRTLRGLPDHLLAALISGLELHGDDLAPRRLFRSPAGGGCAVGVMLRELRPHEFAGGRLRFWVRHGWRRRAARYGGVLSGCPRVGHLESLFDRSVAALQEAAPAMEAADAARVVGRWIARHAEAELGRRHDRVPAGLAVPRRAPLAHSVA